MAKGALTPRGDLPDMLVDGPSGAPFTLALAHGAGQPMDSPFMTFFAEALAERGFRVARFEFPFMAERRKTGKRRPPDRPPVLLATWRKVIARLGPDRLIIGGKSLGGRMASMVADDAAIRGLVCLGYPFHPPGRPERPRIEHLRALETPALILQGTRDPFGTPDEVPTYALAATIRVHWIEGGDHGLTPGKRSGRTERDNWREAIAAVCEFAAGLPTRGPRAGAISRRRPWV